MQKNKQLIVHGFAERPVQLHRFTEDYSPRGGDEARSLQLHALHQQPRLEGPDLHVPGEDGDDVRRLVL